ncbi:hypothetical protein EHI46_29855 [Rhizobium leguminosarum]|nr:hypothetical protein EHI46_29855 [Rhizobium leguminosarum]
MKSQQERRPRFPSTSIGRLHPASFRRGTYDSNLGYWGDTAYSDMMTHTAYPTEKAEKLPPATARRPTLGEEKF